MNEVIISNENINGVILDVSLIDANSVKISDSQNKIGEQNLNYIGEVNVNGEKTHYFNLAPIPGQLLEMYYSPTSDTIYLSDQLIEGERIQKIVFRG